MKLVLVDGGTDVVVEPGFAEKQCVWFYVQVLDSMEVVEKQCVWFYVQVLDSVEVVLCALCVP